MFIESIDHSTPRTIQENESRNKSSTQFQSQNTMKKSTINSKLGKHIFSSSSLDFKLKIQLRLQYRCNCTQKSIAKLEKKLSNDEVIVELICFYLTICSLLYIFVLIQFYQVKNKRISRKNSITKPFKCSNCTHTYSSKAALKQHLKLKHYEEHTPLTQPLDQQKALVEPLSQI